MLWTIYSCSLQAQQNMQACISGRNSAVTQATVDFVVVGVAMDTDVNAIINLQL